MPLTAAWPARPNQVTPPLTSAKAAVTVFAEAQSGRRN
jgi:hypothetical protein